MAKCRNGLVVFTDLVSTADHIEAVVDYDLISLIGFPINLDGQSAFILT